MLGRRRPGRVARGRRTDACLAFQSTSQRWQLPTFCASRLRYDHFVHMTDASPRLHIGTMSSQSLTPPEYADALIAATANLPESVPTVLSFLCLFPSASVPHPTYLAMRSPNPERVVPELRKCKGFLKTEWEEVAAGRVKALLYLSKGGEARSKQDFEAEKDELHHAYECYESALT